MERVAFDHRQLGDCGGLFRESGAEELLSMIVEADFAGIGAPIAVETRLALRKTDLNLV
jgi:hypothetical protein